LKLPLTSAALTKGWQRYRGLGPEFLVAGGVPETSTPGEGRGSKNPDWEDELLIGDFFGARSRLAIAYY
jgi:hypothetical protein